MSFSLCWVCGWESRDWPTHDEAGCESTWHTYEEHPEHWLAIIGDRPPRDPDPRKMEAAQ